MLNNKAESYSLRHSQAGSIQRKLNGLTLLVRLCLQQRANGMPILSHKYKWYAKRRHMNDPCYYAARAINHDGTCDTVLMHRQILGLRQGREPQTDHIDGNGLNKHKRKPTHSNERTEQLESNKIKQAQHKRAPRRMCGR